jgi:hypothetical protein
MATEGRSNSQRVRENEETFAKANEQILARAEHYDFEEPVPFLCECSVVTCTESVKLSLTNYREARARAGAFILLPGHDDPQVERIVADGVGYVLVEKFS